MLKSTPQHFKNITEKGDENKKTTVNHLIACL